MRPFLESAWKLLSPWIESGTVVVVTGLVLVAARTLLKRGAKERTGVPYKRQIATTLIVLAGVFGVIVFLPVDPEVRGQILSLLGVLISAVIALSSTSLVGNAMAGIMMRLSRSYRPGDFIEVGEIIGRVADQGLFHTQVQLITRDIVALPNLYLSRHPVHVTRSSGTFVSVLVSLGYDVPGDVAEEALREAVERAELDEAFVLVEELLDHAITYRVFGLLEDTSGLLSARSRLRRSIVATLHGRGIQIVSPGYVNRVEYPTEHRFIPDEAADAAGPDRPADQTVRDDSDKVEAIAFDKAEEAESIERLYALQTKLEHERDDLDERIKQADREEKSDLQDERTEVERRIERTAEIVKRREEEREEHEREDEQP